MAPFRHFRRRRRGGGGASSFSFVVAVAVAVAVVVVVAAATVDSVVAGGAHPPSPRRRAVSGYVSAPARSATRGIIAGRPRIVDGDVGGRRSGPRPRFVAPEPPPPSFRRSSNRPPSTFALPSSPSSDGAAFGGANGDSPSTTPLAVPAPPAAATNPAERFVGCEILEFVLNEHKPLGCTAEESLAIDDDENDDGSNVKDVFVSKVVEGGNAGSAGIRVGDVVVGVSGTFDDVINVAGLGLERVRALVGGRFPEDPLTLRIARGTNVMSKHESALVDLCYLPGGTDDNLSDCLDAIVRADMDMNDDYDGPVVECEGEDDAECMIDSMYSIWAQEEESLLPAKKVIVEEEEVKPAPKPWSSRSSPSGTYVRDPTTGEMRNIDA